MPVRNSFENKSAQKIVTFQTALFLLETIGNKELN